MGFDVNALWNSLDDALGAGSFNDDKKKDNRWPYSATEGELVISLLGHYRSLQEKGGVSLWVEVDVLRQVCRGDSRTKQCG